MKKSILAVLATTAFGLSGCSSSDDQSVSADGTSETIAIDDTTNTTTTNTTTDIVATADGSNPAGTTRSPQGIPDDSTDRRNNAQNNRRGNRLPEREMIEDIEVRSFDGTSNNLGNVVWGATFSHLQRIGNASYTDGISSMSTGQSGRAGPRVISNRVVSQAEGESIPNLIGASDYTWQWGQFIDHDIDLTDGSADEPQNIPVPIGDTYFDPARTGTAEIPFNRALHDPDTGTSTSNPRQQENEITSWIDGSMVYGSDDTRAAALREGPDSPFLKTSAGNLLPFNTDSLTNANGPVADPTTLFLAGDVRVNEQAGLTAMHTLFVREHNRLAAQLRDNRPQASAESIYQAARRLVIAKIQAITYNEYLPTLLGASAISTYEGYNRSVNPTIYNEFSAAAFRLGHSMVNDNILRISARGQSIADGPLTLVDAFFTAPQLIQRENDIDPILRGLASQPHQQIDVKVIHTLRNLLFGNPAAGGLDLTALNIQRGRDHGLPSYNDARIAMGLEAVTGFSEISSNAQLNQSLQDAYGDVSNIDLWVGGLAESPRRQSQLGELFHAIVVRQFTELRDGDRFWYENYLGQAELNMVRNVTLAGVIRDNTSIGDELQDNVFFVPTETRQPNR